MKTVIPDLIDDQYFFSIDEKKDEAVGVIMTYISQRFSSIPTESTALMKFGRS
jgi:hypothetical protein